MKDYDIRVKTPTPVKRGEKVEVLVNDQWGVAKVMVPLSSQFTATNKEGYRFYMYKDKGLTWRKHIDKTHIQ